MLCYVKNGVDMLSSLSCLHAIRDRQTVVRECHRVVVTYIRRRVTGMVSWVHDAVSCVRAGITVFVWASAQELPLLPVDATCAVDCRLTNVVVFTLIRISTFRVKDMFCAYLCLCLSQFKFQYRFQSIINIISEKHTNN